MKDLELATSHAVASAQWPGRIKVLARAWREATENRVRDELLGEIWTLLNLALQKYARLSAGRFGGIDRDDIRDIAADKALDLVRRLDQHEWDAMASAEQICTFVARVARNGVIDLMRLRSRETHGLDADELGAPTARHDTASPGMVDLVDAEQYARAIVACSERLSRKAQMAWFFRVFYELPSAEISRHPEVASSPAAVDTMLLRCRAGLRACMIAKGFEPDRIPAGTYAILWELFRRPIMAKGRGDKP